MWAASRRCTKAADGSLHVSASLLFLADYFPQSFKAITGPASNIVKQTDERNQYPSRRRPQAFYCPQPGRPPYFLEKDVLLCVFLQTFVTVMDPVGHGGREEEEDGENTARCVQIYFRETLCWDTTAAESLTSVWALLNPLLLTRKFKSERFSERSRSRMKKSFRASHQMKILTFVSRASPVLKEIKQCMNILQKTLHGRKIWSKTTSNPLCSKSTLIQTGTHTSFSPLFYPPILFLLALKTGSWNGPSLCWTAEPLHAGTVNHSGRSYLIIDKLNHNLQTRRATHFGFGDDPSWRLRSRTCKDGLHTVRGGAKGFRWEDLDLFWMEHEVELFSLMFVVCGSVIGGVLL